MKTIVVPRRAPRRGLTLIEIMIVMALSSIIALIVISLFIATYRILSTEMLQNEVDWQCSQLVNAFSSDARAADRIVYDGPGPYTPPGSQSYNYPRDSSGRAITAVPASTKVLVFRIPSYDQNGIIVNQGNRSYDYVGYTWSQPAGAVTGRVLRTCIPALESSRQAHCGAAPGGAEHVSSVNFSFHVAPVSSSPSIYLGLTLLDISVDVSLKLLFLGGSPVIDLKNVDQVGLTAVVSGTSWGQTASIKLTSKTALRNWGKN